MAGIFDEGGYGVPDEEAEDTASQVLSDLESNEDIDQKMSEVEKRLELASYYKLLLNNPLFDIDNDAAQSVQQEIRDFIRSRLEVLVGLKQDVKVIQSALPFDDKEVVALKSLAAKVMGKPSLLQEVKKPTLNKVSVPAAQPQSKTAVTPTKVQTVKAKPGPKPKAKPVPAVEEGVFKDKSGRVFKKTTTDDGKEVVLNVTKQQRGPDVLPMPSGMQMTMATEMNANRSLEAGGNALEGPLGNKGR